MPKTPLAEQKAAHETMGVYSEFELGPFFLPGPTTTFTKRRLKSSRLYARPRHFRFLSCLSTFGV